MKKEDFLNELKQCSKEERQKRIAERFHEYFKKMTGISEEEIEKFKDDLKSGKIILDNEE